MHVETWLYRRLGKPCLNVSGDVLTDVVNDKRTIDWISIDETVSVEGGTKSVPTKRLKSVFARGACDLMAISHYFSFIANEMPVGEFAYYRDKILIRKDHSLFLRHALIGLSEEELMAISKLGLTREDVTTQFFSTSDQNPIWLMSFWGDFGASIYRHRKLGFRIPFSSYSAFTIPCHVDICTVDPSSATSEFQSHWIMEAITSLRSDYDFEGLITEDLFKENLTLFFSRLPRGGRAFLLGAVDEYRNPDGIAYLDPRYSSLNKWCQELAANDERVRFVDIRPLVRDNETQEPNHFDRKVYFRVFETIARYLGV